ncbi:uncharacterized protein LOC110932309 [Helianthus annuus]|nr:uncharacterized protein LOC110932309 [Helianthus annuus]
MGAYESTARSNGTKEEEEDEAMMRLIASAMFGAVAIWGAAKMVDNTDTQERNRQSLVNSSFIRPEGLNQRSIWSPPPRGRFKMNTDGACRPTPVGIMLSRDCVVQRGPSGYGGILRDHNGKWIRGFIGFIGVADCLTSELHGILKGLEILDEFDLKGAILETDSQAAYEWVTRQGVIRGKSEIIHACWSTIMECRQLIRKNYIDVSLVPGEKANRCADKLADMAIEARYKYLEIKYPPPDLKYLVEKDAKFV